MKLIKSIEIRYLRSVHRINIKQLGDLTIFSGANDVGKSNILKTLNLFFNNKVDWLQSVDFYQDFSLRRLDEVRRESVKGKQFIRVSLEFVCPPNYEKSLPPTFSVTKTWFRDSTIPEEKNDLENQDKFGKLPRTLETARRSLSQFLNRIRFEYVPAIRDRTYFEYVLNNLQETLLAKQMQPDDPILMAVRNLNNNLKDRAGSLRENFKRATGIEADVSLPIDPNALFRAFSVSTKWHNLSIEEAIEDNSISLTLRGDGIQARYVSSLLNYIAENSSLFYIWGFEEPENSVEYNLAIELATEFEQIYSRETQIFVTSHSPAFMSLQSSKIVSYRVYKDNNTTQIALLFPSTDEIVLDELSEDIGLFRIQKELYHQYIERRREFEEIRREVVNLQTELEQSIKPVVYVEGKTDEMILNTAWCKLYPDQIMPYVVKNCDPIPEDTSGGAAGYKTLVKFLSTVRSDSKHIAIGIFDRDADGISGYEKELPNYFETNLQLDAKISQNHKAVAFMLPIPEGKQKYAEMLNLCIEFYFNEDALLQQTPEGWGLQFRQPEIEVKVKAKGSPTLETNVSTSNYTRQVINGKTVFAETVTSTLAPSEFEPFKLIFDKIQSILDYLQPQEELGAVDEEDIVSDNQVLTPAQAYRQVLRYVEQFGTISPLLFGRNYYSLNERVHFMFRFSKTHLRGGEDVYFLGVTAQYFRRIHEMDNAFIVFVLGSPDNNLIVSTEIFAEWVEGIEPSISNGVWPLAVYQSAGKDRTEYWVQGRGRQDVSIYLNNYDGIRQLL